MAISAGGTIDIEISNFIMPKIAVCDYFRLVIVRD